MLYSMIPTLQRGGGYIHRYVEYSTLLYSTVYSVLMQPLDYS